MENQLEDDEGRKEPNGEDKERDIAPPERNNDVRRESAGAIAWANHEVPPSDLPRVEAVDYNLHPLRFKSYRVLVTLLIWLGPVAGFVATIIFTEDKGWYSVGAGLVLPIAFSFIAIPIAYRRRAYALRTRDIIYRKGWIFRSTTTVPFNRIQHTEVSQGPLERRFKLATLRIYTAGSSTSDLAIPGLDEEKAGELREFIANKAAVDE